MSTHDSEEMDAAVACLRACGRLADLPEAAASALLGGLTRHQLADLLTAMSTMQALLGPVALPVRLRPFRTGDLGMIAARQAILYAVEQGWGTGLEINELETAATFLRRFTPGREQGWVAELGAAMAGAVLLTDEGEDLARLRLLHVEPFARRRGIGDGLVRGCVDFARVAGYRAITLWTHTVLEDARRLYARHGFTLVDVAEHTMFGAPVRGETWRVELG